MRVAGPIRAVLATDAKPKTRNLWGLERGGRRRGSHGAAGRRQGRVEDGGAAHSLTKSFPPLYRAGFRVSVLGRRLCIFVLLVLSLMGLLVGSAGAAAKESPCWQRLLVAVGNDNWRAAFPLRCSQQALQHVPKNQTYHPLVGLIRVGRRDSVMMLKARHIKLTPATPVPLAIPIPRVRLAARPHGISRPVLVVLFGLALALALAVGAGVRRLPKH